jgi:subtilisin family serine protease
MCPVVLFATLLVLLTISALAAESDRITAWGQSEDELYAQFQNGESPYVPGEIIVNFGLLNAERIKNIKQELKLAFAQRLPTLGIELLKIEDGLDIWTKIAALRERGVAYAEPNYIRFVLARPNDPRYDGVWGLEKMNVPSAWDISIGSDIVIAVVDSGGDWQHEDLIDTTWINSKEDINKNGVFDNGDLNGVDDDKNGYIDDVIGYNFTDDNAIPYNGPLEDMHGTHTSGTIGASGNNRIGISGVLWQSRIMRLKFVSGLTGPDFAAAGAITYAADNGARVINASWGGYSESQTITKAIRYAADNGVVFVAAAGNEGNDNDRRPVFPANCDADNIIVVAATDQRDRLASFSNYGGSTVDVAAPGVGILSTVPNNGYKEEDGTSMAAPSVSGIVGLILTVNSRLSADRVRQILIDTSDSVSSLQGAVVAAGRVNAGKAVSCAADNTCSGGATTQPRCALVSAAQSGNIAPAWLLLGLIPALIGLRLRRNAR